MIYTYINQRVGEPPIVDTYDTDSRAVENVLNWIAAKVAGATAPAWEVKPSLTIYAPGVPDTIGGKPGEVVTTQGNVFFDLPAGTPETDHINDGKIIADLRQCMKNPEGAVAAIIVGANLPVSLESIGKYEDPDANKPKPQDWQMVGARIGPPLASTPNHWTHKGDGGRIGDKWTGASGRNYELVMVGDFAFFKYPAWRGL